MQRPDGKDRRDGQDPVDDGVQNSSDVVHRSKDVPADTISGKVIERGRVAALEECGEEKSNCVQDVNRDTDSDDPDRGLLREDAQEEEGECDLQDDGLSEI